MDKAVIYTRISEDRHDGLGVQRQEKLCRDLAEREGLTVTEVYCDNDISAYSGKSRPRFEALREDMKAGRFDVVLAYAPDRISRSLAEVTDFKVGARLTRTRLIYVNGGAVDLNDPNQSAFSAVGDIFSQWESDIKSVRISDAARQRALAGKPPLGGRRYGYRNVGSRDDRRWEVVPHEAREYRRAVEAVLSGASVRSQVIRLNALGEDYWAPERKKKGTAAPTRSRWSGTTLRNSLMRKDAAGIVRYKDEEYPDVQAQWEPLISVDQHRAIVSLLTNPGRRTNNKPGRSAAYLGTSLYHCGGCGDTMVAWHDGKDPQGNPVMAYTCRNADYARHSTPGGPRGSHVTARMYYVDEAVTEAVIARLADPMIQQAVAATSGDSDRVSHLIADREAIQIQLHDIGDALGTRALTVAQATQATKRLTEDMDKIDKELAARDRSGVLVDVAEASLDPRAWWTDAPLESRRAVLDALAVVTIKPRTRRGGGADLSRIDIQWR
ncbi:recombinase family protein [Corynebacterium nuruki]|uniref:recombinase family protein n=1 Tax=Corynebacterium nuruki TaxID=1032851 RepID=UPI002FE2F116